jgi:hypothetical protein
MDMRVDGARDHANRFQQLCSKRGVLLELGAGELDVDCRRQTEIQNLRDDIGRLEEELDSRELLRQLGAQRSDEFLRGTMIRSQRKQYLAIERAYRPGVAVRQVDAAIGNAEVVQNGLELVGRHDPADRDLDRVGYARGFLDARSGGCTNVQADLTGVDRREEIATQHRIRQDKAHKPRNDRAKAFFRVSSVDKVIE